MPMDLNAQYKGRGTRFSVLPQPRFLSGFEEPETIWISNPPTAISSGPSDETLCVVDALGKPFTDGDDYIPHSGKVLNAPKADAGGHYDAIDLEDEGFRAANVYGSIRRVLDVWEGYLGRPVFWHFLETQKRLQVTPFVEWDNAQFGWGFMELGWSSKKEAGGAASEKDRQFAYNFDVIAHETGHGLIFALAGIPMADGWTAQYRGFHESASDLVALISSLHFEKVLSNLLAVTSGNLYAENEINRIGEVAPGKQIRIASNSLKMTDVPYSDIVPDDLTNKQVHALGEPLTGAFFDLLVLVYQKRLLALEAIPSSLAVLDDDPAAIEARQAELESGYKKAFAKNPHAFRRALCEARDLIGKRLALTWDILSPDFLTYEQVARTFLTVDRHLSNWQHQSDFATCFRWRGIGSTRV